MVFAIVAPAWWLWSKLLLLRIVIILVVLVVVFAIVAPASGNRVGSRSCRSNSSSSGDGSVR